MSEKYFYKRSLNDIYYFSFISFIAYLLLPYNITYKLGFFILGCIPGYFLAQNDWRKIKNSIDGRNKFPYYFGKNFLFTGKFHLLIAISFDYIIVILLALLWLKFKFTLGIIISIYLVFALIYHITIFYSSRKYELENGAIIPLEMYAKTKTGSEGMMHKSGEVISACTPIGKVRIGNEIWNAESIDGNSIDDGEKVLVREIQGLKLIIEKSD